MSFAVPVGGEKFGLYASEGANQSAWISYIPW